MTAIYYWPHTPEEVVLPPPNDKKVKKQRAKAPASTITPLETCDISTIKSYEMSSFLKTCFDIEFKETTLSAVLDALPALDRDGPWLAGGSLRRTLMGEEPDGDFDIFFKDNDQFKTYTKALKKLGFTRVNKKSKNYHEFEGEIAGETRTIQCVNNVFFDDASQVIGSFDFSMCMFGFDGRDIYLGKDAIDGIEKRVIEPNMVTHSTKSMSRLLKYVNQGFMPSKETLLELYRLNRIEQAECDGTY